MTTAAGIKLALLAVLACVCELPVSAQESPPAPPPVGPSPAAPPAPNTKMMVRRFRVGGVSGLLTEAEIHAVLGSFEGRELSTEELTQATQALQDLLKSQGFFLAQVLVLEIKDGEVSLELWPGSIGKITVKDNQAYSSEFIQKRVESALGPDRVLKDKDLARQLMLLNENTDLLVTPEFQPGARKGEVDLILVVKDSTPIHGGIDYDSNYGTALADLHRVSPHLSLGNLIQDGDALNTIYRRGMPDDRTEVVSTSYTLPVDLEGSKLGLSYTSFKLTAELSELDVQGNANIFSLNYNHPLQRTASERQDLNLGYTYKDFSYAIGITPGQVGYHSLRVGYNGDFSDPNGRTLVGASLTQGLGGSALNPLHLPRLDLTPTFTRVNLNLARVQNLDPSFFLLLRGSAQWAPEHLFIYEEMPLGGIDSVRGFNQAQFYGDAGYTLSLEGRWIPWQERRDVQFAVFVDQGWACALQRLKPGQAESISLLGAGCGVRFNLGQAAQMRLDLGWPLSPTRNIKGDSPVFYGQVLTNF